MADGDQTPPSAGGWPPPHPSPPLPPPREYGVPGTSPSRTPYVVGAVAAVLVVALVVLLVVWLTGDDDPATTARDPEPSATASASATPAAATYTCWDGAAAAALEECSQPTGEAGLRWVFPAIADARCGKAAAAGGATTRVLCLARLADGRKVQLGFFEWPGVEQGQAFYGDQGLERTDGTDTVTWSGPGKVATMYAAAPFSVTVTLAGDATPGAEEVAAFAPRPAAELTGVADQ